MPSLLEATRLTFERRISNGLRIAYDGRPMNALVGVAVMAVMFNSTLAIAKPPHEGGYERVGGWSYIEVPNVRSCGKEARDFLIKSGERMRHVVVGPASVKWGADGKPVPIVKRDADQIWASGSTDDTVNGTRVTKVIGWMIQEDSVGFFRQVFASGEAVCADLYLSSLERKPAP
jgi:hypothetical protein